MYSPDFELWMECQNVSAVLPSKLGLSPAVAFSSGIGSMMITGYIGTPKRYTATGLLGPGVKDGRFVIRANAPGLDAARSAAVSTAKPAPTTLTGVVHPDILYSELPAVRVTVQLRDEISMTTHTAKVQLEFIVSSVVDNSVRCTTTVQCGGVATGHCSTELRLPSSFTDTLPRDVLLQISVQAPFVAEDAAGRRLLRRDGSAQLVFVLGTIPYVTVTAPPIDVSANALYTVVPSRGLYAGEEFNLEVRSSFSVYIKVAEIVVTVGQGLSLVGDSFPKDRQGNERFVGTIDRGSSMASSAFSRKGNTVVGDQGSPTNELLFTLRVRVQAGVEAGANATVVLKGLRFKDGGETLLPLDSAGFVASRNVVVEEDSAAVYFDEDDVVAVFAHAGGVCVRCVS